MAYPSFASGDVLLATDMNAVGLWRITNATVTSAGGTSATASNGVITIGSNNTSVTVANAFSASYKNYRIICEGGLASATANMLFQLGGITGSVYSFGGFTSGYAAGTITASTQANGTTAILTQTSASGYSFIMDITNPQQAIVKTYTVNGMGSGVVYSYGGYINSTTAATDFTLTLSTGNISGGTIRIYGYRN